MRQHPAAVETLIPWLGVLLLAGGLSFHAGEFPAPARQPAAAATRARVPADLQTLATALRTYYLVNGTLPTAAQGILALVERSTVPPVPPHWFQLLTQLPKDPWGNDYIYRPRPSKGLEAFDLLSKGKDGAEGTADDICYEVRGKGPGTFFGPVDG